MLFARKIESSLQDPDHSNAKEQSMRRLIFLLSFDTVGGHKPMELMNMAVPLDLRRQSTEQSHKEYRAE